MKLGLLICTFNRPAYLKQCLDSIKRTDLSQVDTVLIVDDCSTDKETIRLINDFELEGVDFIKAYSKKNRSIKGSLLFGLDLLFNSPDILVVTNLDGDAIVKTDFINILLKLRENFADHITTGFCCFTKNRDGSERHKVLEIGDTFTKRKSVGGINMMFDLLQYRKWIRPALVNCLEGGGNWDDWSCRNSMADGKEIITSRPSVVQHIGVGESSMGHGKGGEPPDVAEDFDETIYDELMLELSDPIKCKLDLRRVTLICADGVDINRVIHAADISCRNIEFGAVKILSHLPSNDSRVIKIRQLISKQDYSAFVLKEMVNYVDTDYMMIFQYDGFPINTAAWSEEFLKWDMVGAAWKFRPEKRTANGGFSIRSKKMMEAIRDDDGIYLQNDNIINNYAEDHVLFYIYREYLEQKHGVKIAPEEICDKFSIEGWGVKENKYNGSFGFHGFSVDFNDADLPYIPYKLPNRQIL